MGVLNITPDSFSDGGKLFGPQGVKLDTVLKTAETMLSDGAAILDVGGESTRPGASPVSEQEELERVIPVVEALVSKLGAVVSVDTSTPSVMRESARRGAGLINDVRGLSRDGALQAAADTGFPLCLMHMQGPPHTMQENPDDAGVVEDVLSYLETRVAACEAMGIARERLVIDPGFGFGKTVDHNLQLLDGLSDFTRLSLPLLVGLSRNSLLDKITGRAVDERLAGSITLAALAAERGAHIIRVHDVRETSDALAVVDALLRTKQQRIA
jgi:dihydropteroate synthase